jgi:hypothetical protein
MSEKYAPLRILMTRYRSTASGNDIEAELKGIGQREHGNEINIP